MLATLPLKQLSEPVHARFGWHLIEVLDRRSHDTTDEVKRENCARAIRANKAEEERELWLRRLRDQAFVCNYIVAGVNECMAARTDGAAPRGPTALARRTDSARRSRAANSRRMAADLPVIVVSSGEPAGIGPDICLALAEHPIRARLAVLADSAMLAARATRARRAHWVSRVPHRAADGPAPRRQPAGDADARARAGRRGAARPRQLAVRARSSCAAAWSSVKARAAHALVTAPVQKSVISAAGLRVLGPYRIPRRAHRRRATGDAARGQDRCAWRSRRRTCRCARSPMRSTPRSSSA